MKKLYLLLSFILVGCGAVTPVPTPQSPTFNFQPSPIIKNDAAEKMGLDLTVGIFGVNKNVVFLFGGMMAHDGEYRSLQSTVLRSDNGGSHWDEVMSPVKNSSVRNFSILKSGVGWALILNSDLPYKYTLYQTKDNGQSWQELSIIPLSSDEFPIILQVVWVDELHGQIDILYNNNFGYLEFLTTSDGGTRWKQAGIYKPKFEDNTPTWSILDSYRSRIKEDYESMSLDNSGSWKLDGRYGDPDTNIIVIQHQIFMDDGSLNIQKLVLPKHFEFIDGKIIAPQAR